MIAILLIGGVSAFLLKTPYPPCLRGLRDSCCRDCACFLLAMKYGGVGGGDHQADSAMGFCFGLYSLADISFCACSRLHLCKSDKAKERPTGRILGVGYFSLIRNVFASSLLAGDDVKA
jgi:leader peptidase (prepilin peptidase)/N-methyltransferase